LPRALVAGLLAWGAETSAGAMGAMSRAGVLVLHDGKVGVLLGHQERFEGGGLGGQNRR
jgi:hypothetical protein